MHILDSFIDMSNDKILLYISNTDVAIRYIYIWYT